MSLERLRSIWRMPSATRKAGPFLPNLAQKDMWSLTAPSRSPRFLAATSSRTASEHSPQSHRPPKSAFTPAIYSLVQSSRRPQHSHLADSISMIQTNADGVQPPEGKESLSLSLSATRMCDGHSLSVSLLSLSGTAT
jgi:hypothetical protein